MSEQNNKTFYSKLMSRFFSFLSSKKTTNVYTQRKFGIINQIDFLLDTLHGNKLDIVYMENLKMPLTQDEKIYFVQQLNRIERSIEILSYFRVKVLENSNFWKKFLNWKNL